MVWKVSQPYLQQIVLVCVAALPPLCLVCLPLSALFAAARAVLMVQCRILAWASRTRTCLSAADSAESRKGGRRVCRVGQRGAESAGGVLAIFFD